MNTKKTMKIVVFILLIAMTVLCFGGCEESPAEKEESPAEKEERFNEEKENLKSKIETTVCTTSEEFGNLMVEVIQEVRTANALFGQRYKDQCVEMDISKEDSYCSDITMMLRKNKSIMAYFDAPYTDKIPDVLHAKGLHASDIIGLYNYVADDYDIRRYAVNGWYPLSGYLISNTAISKDEIAEILKKKLRNPESLQIHEIECFRKMETMFSDLEKAENKCSNYDVGCAIVDYSAQNGFGGYDRKKAWINISAVGYSDNYYLSLKTIDYRGKSTPDGYLSNSFGMHFFHPDWKENN